MITTPCQILGIDVGGTKIAAGVIAWPGGRIIAKRTIPTLPSRGGRSVLDDVIGLARGFAGEGVHAIGLGVCELVDRDGNLASGSCLRWLDLPVGAELSMIAPTVIEADVRAAALAEAQFGAGRGLQSFLYVTVGTGISCSLVINGVPWLGAHGATGTMASSPLSIPCEHCAHISRRTLEEIAAGPALVARFNAAAGHAASGQEVLAAAAAGNALAEKIVASAGEALESQIGLLVNTLDPEAVIIGGGLGLSDGPYWDHFIAAPRRHIWSGVHRDLPILRATTGTDAGWIGAATRAAEHFSVIPSSTTATP